jgi:hypothetical protein
MVARVSAQEAERRGWENCGTPIQGIRYHAHVMTSLQARIRAAQGAPASLETET